MPFSDDEQIPTLDQKAVKLKQIILFISVGLFILSLFFTAYCTESYCKRSAEVLFLGVFGFMFGGAAMSWLANLFLVIAWILFFKGKRISLFFSVPAVLFSSSFLLFHKVIENEAGTYATITKVGAGYWLWLASCLVTLIGSIIMAVRKNKNASVSEGI